MTSLVEDYAARGAASDEMLAPDGGVRESWRPLGEALATMGAEELHRRQREAADLMQADGVSYHVPGTGERMQWQLDALPLIISATSWARLSAGVAQRAELLNLILTDLYGPRTILRRGLVPPQVVLGHRGFLRPLHGARMPAQQQLFSYAVDLARVGDGTAVVLGDRTQAPSGAAYALQNRVVTSRVFTQLHRRSQVQRLAPYFRALRQGLQAVAPPGTTLPRTVLLSPGSRNETAFEHAYLATKLGLSLVEGSDLVVENGRVWLRSLGHLEPIDVIVRRLDEDFSDPLELRPDSLIGVPGLIEAIRNRTVTVVNMPGSGVLENAGLQPFLERLAQTLLGQSLQLKGPRTLWCGEEESRREVLARLDALVVKPLARSVGDDNSILGWELDDRARQALRARILSAPWRWVGQEPVTPAFAPSFSGNGLIPRRTVLRAFAVADGDRYVVMPGGLTRVAADDRLLIANHRGALSKDTWVISDAPEEMTGLWLQAGPAETVTPETAMSSRAAENLFWLGRYAERAEGVARLLRDVDDRRTEFTDRPEQAGTACITALMQALTHVTTTYPGFVGVGAEHLLVEPGPELRRIAGDRTVPGTLAHAITQMLDAVDAVRDQLSTDTWLVVTDLQAQVRMTEHVSTDVAKILHGLLAIQGLQAENMVRDPGWRFMDAGRRLERALQLIALLRATTTRVRDQAADSLVLESVLRVTESIITYRRRYRSRAQVSTLLDLLLMDPSNPRAITYQLDRLTEDLRALPGHPGEGRLTAAQRAVLEASTALRVADSGRLADDIDDGLRASLDAFLGHLYELLSRAALEVAGRHFTHRMRQQVMSGDVGVGTMASGAA